MDRRQFLTFAGAACGTALVGSSAQGAGEVTQDAREFDAVLVDIGRCTGCRKCEEVCAESHGLATPDIRDKSVFDEVRPTTAARRAVVNRYQTSRGEVFVKRQCMNCSQPACASACLVKAMKKTEGGAVTWDGSKCMGCRFCMVSCPFDMPKFEYDSANPRIEKCDLCQDRLEAGQDPRCVAACPVEALVFGKRSELIKLARERILQNQDQYVNHIYGEQEVGGTCWLYISPVPFEELGFDTSLGTIPYPEYTKEFLSKVPLVLFLWPAFLYGASQISRGKLPEPPPDTDPGQEVRT